MSPLTKFSIQKVPITQVYHDKKVSLMHLILAEILKTICTLLLGLVMTKSVFKSKEKLAFDLILVIFETKRLVANLIFKI